MTDEGRKVVTVQHRDKKRGNRYLFLSTRYRIKRKDLQRMKHDGWDISVVEDKYVDEETK